MKQQALQHAATAAVLRCFCIGCLVLWTINLVHIAGETPAVAAAAAAACSLTKWTRMSATAAALHATLHVCRWYGTVQGYSSFRRCLAAFLSDATQHKVDPDELLITAGALAMDMMICG